MNDYMLTKKAVIAATGRSATSLWRDVKAGIFPAPRQLGPNRIGWLNSEVQAWIESRPVVNREINAVRKKIGDLQTHD
jgi:prophage regulatory protein